MILFFLSPQLHTDDEWNLSDIYQPAYSDFGCLDTVFLDLYLFRLDLDSDFDPGLFQPALAPVVLLDLCPIPVS